MQEYKSDEYSYFESSFAAIGEYSIIHLEYIWVRIEIQKKYWSF